MADVVHDIVVGSHHADVALTPHVLRAPVPAFPAVGVADLLREAAHLVEQQRGAAVRRMHHLALTMAVLLNEDGQRTVRVADACNLVGDDLRSLLPGDAHELALAAILRVALALRIPVDPLQRELDPVRRIGALFVGQTPGSRDRLEERLERLAVLLHLPWVRKLLGVLLIPMERPDPDDLAVPDIDVAGTCSEDATAQSKGLQDRLIRSRCFGCHP